MEQFSRMDKELIEEKFRGVYSRLDSNNEIMHVELKEISNLLKLTHEQACKTNGRVTKLEKETGLIRWLTNKPIRLISAIAFIFGCIEYAPDLLKQLIKILV